MKISKLFSSWRGWTKNVYASTRRSGLRVEPRNAAATCWCLAGAIRKCYPESEQSTVIERLANSIQELFPRRIGESFRSFAVVINFNDAPSTRFADVLRVVRHAKV
jgi:hypothetical protein